MQRKVALGQGFNSPQLHHFRGRSDETGAISHLKAPSSTAGRFCLYTIVIVYVYNYGELRYVYNVNAETKCFCGLCQPDWEALDQDTFTLTESSTATGSSTFGGPRCCAVCGEWPALETAFGLRCHLCECRAYAAVHPVPLPENPEMLSDLAGIGVPGAAEKLAVALRT